MLFGQPEGFGLYWNGADFPAGRPKVISHDPSTSTAVVSYNGLARTLEARFEARRPPSFDTLGVSGFAARFRTGRVLWNATVEFWFRDGEWDHVFTHLFDCPHSKGPATIVGFLQDFPPRQRGTGGFRRMIEDRARAGHPDGPANAAEVGREWERSQRAKG